MTYLLACSLNCFLACAYQVRLKTKQLRLLQPQEFRLATERIYKHDTLTETLWNSLDAGAYLDLT
jgi:hypothetical protein